MSDVFIAVEVRDDESVHCYDPDTGAHARPGRLHLDSVDRQLLKHVSRWLAIRERGWDIDEIQVLGMLLHRCLLADVWPWLRGRLEQHRDKTVHLFLAFSGEADPFITSIPWEFLHTPYGSQPFGFLARHPGLVLSRYAPGEVDQPAAGGWHRTPAEHEAVTVLPIVSDADPERLGEIDAKRVLDSLKALDPASGYRALPALHQPTELQLRSAVADNHPGLLHFIGHGEFDTKLKRGRVALIHPVGGADWVDEHRLADAVCQPGATPLGVILHTCEGGQVDNADRFAGLAPELIRRGVRCVVAMQYAVDIDIAEAFAIELYGQLAKSVPLDVALQACRDRLVQLPGSDPRLVGMPVLFQSTRDPLPKRTAPGEVAP